MNIVFGDIAEDLKERFMCLELDTIRDPTTDQRHTAWCVIENIPLDEMPIADHLRQAHHDLMQAYREQQWHKCREAIQGLRGRWAGEMDSFYDILGQRVDDLSQQELPTGWDGSIVGTEIRV